MGSRENDINFGLTDSLRVMNREIAHSNKKIRHARYFGWKKGLEFDHLIGGGTVTGHSLRLQIGDGVIISVALNSQAKFALDAKFIEAGK